MLPIEPELKLALALTTSPGSYALLLGSGVSRAASIPTGWEVVLDLVKKLPGADHADPAEWYRKKYGVEPDFGQLLEELMPTQTERRNFLYSEFEPNPEDRSEGRKVPTKAHGAIAELCKAGLVKMILTTNFDRLVETALEEAGVRHDLVVADHGIDGAVPYVHSPCYVLKLHGDYRDMRLRNTPAELKSYPKPLNALLDRILDDFGLIICGWSAEWDVALHDAITRAPNRRYTTFWLTRKELTGRAGALAAARRAVVVRITDADQAFSLLLEKTRSLAESAQPHPLSTEVAVADVKRYAPDPLARVRLDDLFKAETRDVIRRVAELPSPQPTPKEWNKDFVRQQMELARSYSDRLLQMAAALAYHGSNDQAGLLVRSVEQLAGSRPIRERYQGIRLYPALLLAYSAGIAALAGERHKTLAALLLKPRIRPSSATREFSPLGEYVHSWGGSPGDTRFQELEYPLLSYRLKETLLALGGQYATVPEEYENLFWLFEFHFALALMETSGEIPVCLGVSNHDFALPDSQIRYTICPAISELVSLAESGNPDVPVLQAGFFGGDLQRLKDAVAKLKVRTQECRRHMM